MNKLKKIINAKIHWLGWSVKDRKITSRVSHNKTSTFTLFTNNGKILHWVEFPTISFVNWGYLLHCGFMFEEIFYYQVESFKISKQLSTLPIQRKVCLFPSLKSTSANPNPLEAYVKCPVPIHNQISVFINSSTNFGTETLSLVNFYEKFTYWNAHQI